ncbi:heat shock factor protein 3-like [Spea bombifrons]|uniref:heat shock factor protein 3-like n=1 Tax=Spea bombifrons TaxID=233779 RepID=UPI00234AA6B5|nr:heat shock factor protein 3-like [Spea bombifrons]
MKEPTAPQCNSIVPAFLVKLWTLVEDPTNVDVISWNWNGQNFCILDEQRFSKEILPKYFKHNNLSSFIRQLNMYGFRKVMNLESGLAKSEHGTPIEFTHPCFKKGKAELLENIKRKMSSVKTEDPHLSQDELQKVFSELQELKDAQNDVDTKLENMRRENETLWKEVSSLRRRHSQQQKLLAKILQFILSLMRGNIVMGNKRKRPLTIEASQPPSKYGCHVLHFPENKRKRMNLHSQHPGTSTDDVFIIHEISGPGEGTSDVPPPAIEQPRNYIVPPVTPTNTEKHQNVEEVILVGDPVLNSQLPNPEQPMIPSGCLDEDGLALDICHTNSSEDTDSVINSILNENNTQSSADMLDCEEIQDFLSCIDASLEDLQSILSKKRLNVEADFLEGLFKPDLLSSDTTVTENNAGPLSELQDSDKQVTLPDDEDLLNKGKQLMQYTGNHVLSLFDELTAANSGSPSDPIDHLAGAAESILPDSSTEQRGSALEEDACKEVNLLVEDFSGSHGLPIFVLSPVNKLIDEATETDNV